MLTLALTVVVPDTVEPWVGDVTVTIRLPSNWAEAVAATATSRPGPSTAPPARKTEDEAYQHAWALLSWLQEPR